MLSYLPDLPVLDQDHCGYGVLSFSLAVVFLLSWWTNRKSLLKSYDEWEEAVKAEERKAEEKAQRAEERALKARKGS